MLNWLSAFDIAWMAWTIPVGIFFGSIAVALAILTVLAIRYPETPRRGILRISTTRGDRLFITLLGSAFINLFWIAFSVALGFTEIGLWGALGLSALYGIAVFRYV
jgi:predicted small integral membrane protein